ncbi:uncharacterized protein LOC118436659 [Folsomia candida]|uniref:F-box domain-containing protein n=1 Tax=Folsomia candida TaxID=158441 RepID=A0A226DXS1_FOLCA|nr:uncharacterized protein LOC118436659 [Folsomia candida]XP_035711065.1 uncharacterized protein LOC118436659 [Folsomia candida]OXA49860.1 hypothetical protein Fcan01_15379 [Folsomia candida]
MNLEPDSISSRRRNPFKCANLSELFHWKFVTRCLNRVRGGQTDMIPHLPSLVLTLIFNHLWKTCPSELFKCRLVCNLWNDEVLSILIKEGFSSAYFTGEDFSRNPAKFLKNYRLHSHKSPLILNNWVFDVPSCGILENYSSYLMVKYRETRFKREILHFRRQDYSAGVKSVKIIVNDFLLREFLIFNLFRKLCHTLDTIELVFNPLVCRNWTVPWPSVAVSGFSSLTELRVDFGPYPEWGHLYSDCPAWFDGFLKAAWPSVEVLKLVRGEALIPLWDLRPPSFPNLTHLELGIRRLHPNLDGLLEFNGQLQVLTIYRVDSRWEKPHTKGTLRSDGLNSGEYLTLLVEKHAETLTELTLPLPQISYEVFKLPQSLPRLRLLSVAFCEWTKVEILPGDYILPELRELYLNPEWEAMYVDDEDLFWQKETFKEFFKLAGSCRNLQTMKIAQLNVEQIFVGAISPSKMRTLMEKYFKDVFQIMNACTGLKSEWVSKFGEQVDTFMQMGDHP